MDAQVATSLSSSPSSSSSSSSCGKNFARKFLGFRIFLLDLSLVQRGDTHNNNYRLTLVCISYSFFFLTRYVVFLLFFSLSLCFGFLVLENRETLFTRTHIT